MRKHDVRKWLHAILDLLPVILIPVFMIYSHRHEINGSTATYRTNVVYESNVVETNNDLQVGNIYYWEDTIQPGEISSWVNFNFLLDIDLYKHEFPQYETYDITKISFYLDENLSVYNEVVGNNFSTFYQNLTNVPFNFIIISYNNVNNVPSSILSHIKYSNLKYSKGLQYVTYNDTDIMSQLTYQLYNSVDKYFNMGNVFNLNGVYDWFNLNIFNGQAPIYVYIVWQIVLYEFVMDLLFLLYGLFMWFIDMIQKLMEKPLNSVK